MNESIKTDKILRDYLAIDRTKLASQRTSLTYLRTVLMLLASAVGVIKLFGTDFITVMLAVILVLIAILVTAIGITSYKRVKECIGDIFTFEN